MQLKPFRRYPFVEDPPSEDIAAELQARDALTCEHGRNPCFARCGVERPVRVTEQREHRENYFFYRTLATPAGPWRVLSKEERLVWKQKVYVEQGK